MLQSGGRVWAAVSQIDHERQHKSRYSLHTRRRATFLAKFGYIPSFAIVFLNLTISYIMHVQHSEKYKTNHP